MKTTAATGETLTVGMTVEFESSYGPGTPVKTRRGVVQYIPGSRYPGQIQVQADCGAIAMMADRLRVV